MSGKTLVKRKNTKGEIMEKEVRKVILTMKQRIIKHADRSVFLKQLLRVRP